MPQSAASEKDKQSMLRGNCMRCQYGLVLHFYCAVRILFWLKPCQFFNHFSHKGVQDFPSA